MLTKKQSGFTLIEILIAMFIFTILSLILMTALHNVINVQSGTEQHAAKLRQLQMALLMLSRDVEQAVNRPVLNASGKPDPAFIGTARQMIFTHGGLAITSDTLKRSNMQRTQYLAYDNAFWRYTFPALDQAPDSKPADRKLLDDVTNVHFQYLDDKNRFHDEWPIVGQSNTQPLPRAVRVYITISNWGSLSQLYVIPTQPGKQISASPDA